MAELNPLDWLAIAQVVQSEAQRKKVAPQEEYERGLVGQRLTPFGGNIADYQKEWQAGYNPQAALSEAMAKSRGEYWSGLSDVMLRAAKEGAKTGSGSGTQVPSSPTYNPAQILAAMYGPDVFARGSTSFGMGPTTSPQIGEGAMGARAARAPVSPPRARSVSAPRSRQVRF